MLDQFLRENRQEILGSTEGKTIELAGDHPSSALLKAGLPIFLGQIVEIIKYAHDPSDPPRKNIAAIAKAADESDEPAMAEAAGQPDEAALAVSAGTHGIELRRLGYTLSHVVHAYGAMCQSITETASRKSFPITSVEFHVLNRCLDVAIAGAVTEFQSHKDSAERKMPAESEMQKAVTGAMVAFQSIKSGTVGVGGSTGRVLEGYLNKMNELLELSRTSKTRL